MVTPKLATLMIYVFVVLLEQVYLISSLAHIVPCSYRPLLILSLAPKKEQATPTGMHTEETCLSARHSLLYRHDNSLFTVHACAEYEHYHIVPGKRPPPNFASFVVF